MKHCSNCGQEFEGNFCPNCGKVADGALKCPKCGTEITGNFCPNCGYSVHGVKPASAETQRKSIDLSKITGSAAFVFVKKHWALLLVAVLLLVAFLTLMITLVGLRGIYVNVDNPDDYYDFDATSYRASTIDLHTGKDTLEEGTWKLSGNKLTLTINDEDFGKMSDDFDFEKVDGFKRVKIDDVEYKRVSLVGLKTTKQKLKIKFDAQGGNGGETKKLKIGAKLPTLEDWKIKEITHSEGYTFLGWYTEPDGKGSPYEENERMWENRTYYAYWQCTEHVADTYHIVGDYHWQVCTRCGQEFNRGSHNITWVAITPATCTQDGTEAYQCECGYKEDTYATRTVPATGHSFDEWVIEGTHTCGDTVSRYRKCKKCDYTETEDSYLLAHDFDPITRQCKLCHNTNLDKGDALYFGKYPQTKETDNGITATLAQMSGDKPSKGNAGTWTDYGYYISGSTSEYMWYIDLEYGGERYRGVYFTSYRPDYTTNSSSTNSYQDDNGYYINTLYWFKWEPIEWRVLERTSGEALLMSNVILDSQQYYHDANETRTIDGKTVYPNNYKESDIRAWLNGTFFEWAFDELDQSIIKTTLVNNSAATTLSSSNSYACENTNDKVFLLSYKDVINTNYGFSSYFENYDTARRLTTTGYAQSQGAYTETASSYRGNGRWWLRSPSHYISNNALGVSNYGDADNSYYVGDTYYGVVPALRITL